MGRKRRLGKRYRRNPETSRSNPPLMTDIVEFVAPGFASFAASRLLTRIASTQLSKRKPGWGKHGGALAAVAAFAAAWFGAHRLKWLEQYHTPIVVGSAIAALQSLIQLYVPGLGWMVSDATPELASGTDPNGIGIQLAAPNSASGKIQGAVLLDEDPNEYVYNDSFDPGVAVKPAAGDQRISEEELITDIQAEDLGDLNLGSLGVS